MELWKERAEWYGHAAHFICGRWCRFHLATIVGPPDARILVSTVGDYFRRTGMAESDEKREQVGYSPSGDAWFETMVFRADGERCDDPDCKCGMPLPKSYTELACKRHANAGEATLRHLEWCAEWDAKVLAPEGSTCE